MAQPGAKKCCVIGKRPRLRYLGQIENYYAGDGKYIAFYDIPYAQAPKGLERYQNPERIIKLLPVLVFIHGGGFSCGTNDPETFSPEFIIRHGVVFVTIKYRLGLSGFLNLHMKECPGNAGLKDQVRALEWIRDNIECFKGDPKNVTLSGSSAGGTCVNLHLIAPMSKDLFHKAIVQAGGVYSCWGYRGHRREQKRLLLGDPKCKNLLFAEVELPELHRYASKLLIEDGRRRHPFSMSPYFGPSVETCSEEAFISEDIEEMMKKVDHDKPVMAGIACEEGIEAFITEEHTYYSNDLVEKDRNFCQLLMDNFRWSFETAQQFFNEIRDAYFPERFTLTGGDREFCFSKLARDILFRRFYDNFKFGPQKVTHKNLYVYRFDHVSEISKVKRKNLYPFFFGATHEDELKYLYCPRKAEYRRYTCPGPYQNKEIKVVIDHMCSLWANFCKTGIPKSDFAPEVEWKRHTDEEPCYLSISKELVLEKGFLFQTNWAWLNGLVEKQPKVKSADSSPTR